MPMRRDTTSHATASRRRSALALLAGAGLLAALGAAPVPQPKDQPKDQPQPATQPAEPERQPAARPRSTYRSIAVPQDPTDPQILPPTELGLPDLPFKPVAVHDDDGRLIPIEYPATELAVWVNPTLSDEERDFIETLLIDRRFRHAAVVIQHLSLMEDIEAGAFEKITISQSSTLVDAQQYIMAFMGMTELSADLQTSGFLEHKQVHFNQYIANAYYIEALRQYKADHIAAAKEAGREPAADIDLTTRFYLLASLEDELMAYRMLLDAVITEWEAVASTIGDTLDPELLKPIEAAAFANADKDRADRLDAARESLRHLSLEQRRAVLTAASGFIPATSRPR